MVLVHVHRFPNKQNHTRNPPKRNQLSTHNLPKRRQPSMRNPSKRNRRGGACVPARTSAQRRFHTKKYTHCVWGIERWMRPYGATRAGTQAPPLPISIIFVHAIPHKQNNHLHAIHPNDINRPHTIHPNEMRRGGACVPARTSAQRRFHTQMNEYNYTTHRGRKCIAHSRPHSLKQVVYANWHRDDALLF